MDGYGGSATSVKLRMKWRKSRVSRCFLKAELDVTLVQSKSSESRYSLPFLASMSRRENPCFDSKDRMPGVRSDCGSTGSGSDALIRNAAMLYVSFRFLLCIDNSMTTVHPKLEQV